MVWSHIADGPMSGKCLEARESIFSKFSWFPVRDIISLTLGGAPEDM